MVVTLLPVCVLGQTAATAKISGVVTDSNGAVVRGATVKLVDKTTNAEKIATTNEEGSYVFAGLNPATYEITTTAQGFATQVILDVKADVAKTVTLDISLKPDTVSGTVTVTATNEIQLKTADSSVGNVLDADRVKRLPNLNRQVTSLLPLQPAVATDGSVSGSRSDQNVFNFDGLDVSDNIGFRGSIGTVVPIPTEGVEEFGVTVSNPNATFGRAAGAQVTIISKRGANLFHGSLYAYHENDNLNANSWNNNRLGLVRPELKDTRFGGTIGGPIMKDKFFFFFNYEGRRRPASAQITRIVPTQSLRNGILRFRDASGAIFTPNLTTLDPRGLGSNPLIRNALNLLPLPNSSGGDGLNTGVFTANLPTSLNSDYGNLRLDYQINQNWSLYTRGSAFRSTQPGGGQANLLTREFGDVLTQRPKNLLVSLTGTLSPTFINEFRVGHAFDNFVLSTITPSPTTGFNLPVDLGGVAEPIDVGVSSRKQALSGGNTEFLDNVTWLKGTHTLQFGGNFRNITTLHFRNDKFGLISTPSAFIGAGNNVAIPASQRPPSCSTTVTTNCLQSADVGTYNQFYAMLLGIVDNVTYLATRDANLNALPPGTGLTSDTSFRYYQFYFADTWRLKPSLTLSYGLQYQWNTAPEEKQGQQTVLIYRGTNNLVDPVDYLRQKRDAAEAGQIFNPDLAYLPVKNAGRTGTFDIDRKNFSPRISLAWQPSYKTGILGRVFGERQTVIRGGYGLLYDRLNTVSSAVLPILGVGFAQTLTNAGPRNAANLPFRVGVDGPIPQPPPNLSVTPPIVPNKVVGLSTAFGELLSLSLDPKLRNPRNHVIDFSIQRELPGKMLLEVGYIGRFGRKLYQNVDLNSAPYFFRDPASGQRFSEAFDIIATQLRNGQAVTPQPWFDNQFAGIAAVFGLPPTTPATTVLVNVLGLAPYFQSGDVSFVWNVFLDGVRDGFLGRPAYHNRQVGGLFVRTNLGKSNYNAMFVSLRKRLSHGLTFDANYTLSKSLDQTGFIQNAAVTFSNSFFPDLDYGPSGFDSRHVFNANAVYDLPFGKGHRFSTGNWADKLIGGWYLSGIYTASSGLPLTVFQGSLVGAGGAGFGGGLFTSAIAGAIPISSPNYSNSVHSSVAGTGGIGTGGNPATRGSGLNLFADPQAVFNNFRPALISLDGRQGNGVLRGLSNWNLDLSIGKTTKIGERVKFGITLDFFNVFNRVNFNNPNLNTQDRTNFGVINGAFGSRKIQIGGRFEF